jgi:hypothetical protein
LQFTYPLNIQAPAKAFTHKSEHPALQNKKFPTYYLFLCDFFPLLDQDPDPADQKINADPDPGSEKLYLKQVDNSEDKKKVNMKSESVIVKRGVHSEKIIYKTVTTKLSQKSNQGLPLK